MQIIVTFMFLFTIFEFTGLWSQTQAIEAEKTTRSWSEIVYYAKANFQQEGTLVMNPDGYIYLKVDDDYIRRLFPMLGLKRYTEPPYFRTPISPGAHISVIYRDENVKPTEIGKTFPFTLKKIVIVRVHSQNASYAILEVESKELEQLRKKYGLSPKLQGHEFHISLAKKIHRNQQKNH